METVLLVAGGVICGAAGWFWVIVPVANAILRPVADRVVLHDMRADRLATQMVEHSIAFLLQHRAHLSEDEILEKVERGLRDNGITNPTAFGLLRLDTVQRLRIAPPSHVDLQQVYLVLDEERVD